MNIAALHTGDSRSMLIQRAVFHLRRNELAEANSLLAQALSRSPDDPAFLHLSGTVRRLEHRPEEAEGLYRRALATGPRQPHVHRDLGKLLASLGRLDEATAELREALRLKLDDADAHLCLAAALARQGRPEAAETSYREVLRLQPGHLVARLGLAEALCNRGRPDEAEWILRQAPATREPALAAALAHRLGITLKQQKKYTQALALFDAAQSYQPDSPAIDYVRGETLQQMGQWEQAGLSFRKVLAQRPGHANAAACLALISALTGDFAEAREWATKALARALVHGIARIALALAEIEAGDFAAASARLREVLEDEGAPKAEGTAVASGFAADAFDSHHRYAEAFAVSRASKAMLREVWPAQAGEQRMTDVAWELTNYLENAEPWSAGEDSNRSADQPASHVFLLGFLRSGTTLVETILATDPNVVHADEVDLLGEAARAFVMDKTGIARMAALSEDDLTQWRTSYWRTVREAQFATGGKVFVDKMPINTFRLPLIARLFPRAKIVFAIRDPRDVVLSCFRRHFDRTAYSMEFLQLEDCARLYASAMALADVCRKKLPLDILELRYESIIDDFDSTVGTLCDFTGVNWNETMRDFRRAADTIDLRSASARQVRRGLYAGAVGHWRNYREELAPVLPILALWVARFGYPAE